MKTRRTRILAIFFTILLAVGLAGCGSSGSDKASSSGKNEITLALWDANQKPAMEEMSKAFMKENPDIKVNVELTPWDQYWTKLQAAATGGNMADVFWMSPEQIFTYAQGDALLDLNDKIKADKFDMTKYPENLVDALKVDDKQLAIPKDNSTVALWYNKDLFDKARVSYPDDTWTWDTWMDAAKKLTDKKAGIYGMLAPNNGQNFIYNLIYQNGSDFFTKDGKKSLYDSPKTIEAVEYGTEFIKKGYSPSIADFSNTTPDQYFESGKAAMVTAGSWMNSEYLSIDGLNVGVAPMPKKADHGTISAGMGYSIAAKTKNPDAAWKFVQYMGGKDANLIQSKSGAAISAYDGTQQPYVDKFPTIDAQVFVDAAKYGHSSYMVPSRADWLSMEEDMMINIFSGQISAKKGCTELAKQINDVIANQK
ncbi:sugar ABC transporter substrate-binding protein [Listeria booriae]|uniref:extracellular solute-binding protein n=1 Tax=Listeria booriae TaxID=1552123 RepID=UPI0016257D25|nr:sugar ABC transporter substrate-binding protein [Listeria booriae]MBC2316210.1 sugar ABC transporter substrate-binding protein [Listeria booriae]